MAEGGPLDPVIQQQEREREARRLAFLFRGRFNDEVAERIIKDKGDLQGALNFLLNGNEDEVREYLQQNEEYLRAMRNDAANVATILDNVIEKTDRQFACAGCQKSWWKRVPERKEVSKCFSCRVKYDPIPRDKEWGWGQFICHCGHEFKGFAIMGRTISKCYDCNGPVRPDHILPPKKREGPPVRTPFRNPHNCNGVNCMLQNEFAHLDKPCACVHPRSEEMPLNPPGVRIHCASQRHVSTGSTVATFLSQGSLDTDDRSIAPSLATLREDPDYRGGPGHAGFNRGAFLGRDNYLGFGGHPGRGRGLGRGGRGRGGV